MRTRKIKRKPKKRLTYFTADQAYALGILKERCLKCKDVIPAKDGVYTTAGEFVCNSCCNADESII